MLMPLELIQRALVEQTMLSQEDMRGVQRSSLVQASPPVFHVECILTLA